MLHHFTESIEGVVLPSLFTFPFHYTPHPLCIKAAEEVQVYLAGQQQWAAELAEGKMFGVLVVQTPEGEVGFLAAFSGNLAHGNRYSYFVPPVFDLLQPDGFFCIE
ncbi:MAG: RNA pseudouridine synthase, partial [Bacteroidaceae bacterium]|nr:RNA pseudouridine synthase [Bacteroidaceae bacterium]